MIPLRLPAETDGIDHPFVVRLNAIGLHGDTEHDALLRHMDGDALEFSVGPARLRIRNAPPEELDGDVLLVVPQRRVAHRLLRAGSDHNTLLVTERCDQLCVMCSQPPKEHHVDFFDHFEIAAALAPPEAVIGISGGEPTLYKDRLFRFLDRVLSVRPDLGFHILTNGQHFEAGDAGSLASFPRDQVAWGIPLYSSAASTHDAIVGKPGAFGRLMDTFPILARAGATIELRTVVLASNVDGLPDLARMLSAHLPFVGTWAIMQLENIGFARRDWDRLFFDNSLEFGPIGAAVDTAQARGMRPLLYNFPLCTVPEPYRHLAPPTISDWKRRYLPSCAPCPARLGCGGFFEWYPDERGFRRVGLQ